MLPRVPETEVMDTAEEARAYDSMDHSTVNRLFVEALLSEWSGPGPVLDVGTGTAQIPIEICRRHPTVNIVGIDLAVAMLELGRKNVDQAGFAGRIRLEQQDAKRLTYANGTFGAVVSNSIIHHIPDPAAVFAEMIRVRQAGGRLFVRDLLRPADEATLARLVETYGGDDAHGRTMFGESLHAALTLDEVRQLVSAHGFAANGVTQTSDRHWTWVLK